MSKAKVIAIIPARMASTRFPGKPLANILGLPMIEHIRQRAMLCPLISEVIIATCDQEIYDAVLRYGGQAVMTADNHERGSDRVAEAAAQFEADIVINVQGDEPLINPAMFEPLLVPLLSEPELVCTNLMVKINSKKIFNNPNVVKAVCDQRGNALYFSREPIPSVEKAENNKFVKYQQLGIYAFRRDFLLAFADLEPTPLEKIESVDMLRVIEHGYPLRMVLSPFPAIGVDTSADLERAIALMKNDPIVNSYLSEKVKT